jgi:crotonobetainyl-CoA:carnitine CoA-transferase CaiB-like acyl-CoA transferase
VSPGLRPARGGGAKAGGEPFHAPIGPNILRDQTLRAFSEEHLVAELDRCPYLAAFDQVGMGFEDGIDLLGIGNLGIGDSIAGLYAAFGIAAALWQRDRNGGEKRGRSIDVALTESVLSMMEGLLPEYSVLGAVRQPTGSRIPTAAPSNAYPTADDKWILIAGNFDPIFTRLAKLIGRPEIASDPRFIGNRARVQNVEQLDAMIAAWTKRFPGAEVDRMVSEADIPSCLLYTAAEITADPQFRKRGMVREVNDPLFGQVLHAGVVPHVSDNPGTVRWPGARIGEHTEEVMRNLLGLKPAEIEKLRQEGVL